MNDNTTFENCRSEFLALCNKYHYMGLTVVVGFHQYDPMDNSEQTSYCCAGSCASCIGVAAQVYEMILHPGSDEE